MSKRIECDKCGRDDLAPLRPERFAVQIKMPTRNLSIDLCEECARRLVAWCREHDPQVAERPASASAADAASKPKTGLGDGSEIHRDGGEAL